MEKRGRGRQPWLLHYYRKKWVLIMRYQIRHARVQFGGDVILRDVNFEVHDREKIAIVGRNGCGKTTLLRLIAGDIEMSNPDSDEECGITMAGGQEIGFLRQVNFVDAEVTVEDELKKVFVPVFACEERMKELEEQMKTAAETKETAPDGALLREYDRLQKQMEAMRGYSWRPDIMLLDEPTNHLDLPTIEWLENYLKGYDKAVVIVSHDRYFLDRVVTKVVEIFQHQGYVYQGNYTEFAKKKAKIREDLLKQYYNQQREIKHQEEVITKLKSFNREKSIKRAESREKMLDKIERLEKPTDENTDIHIVLEPDVTSGNDVLTVEHLRKAFGTHTLFDDLSFEIKRGERVALIGNNGTGKTTILKIINELLLADGGTIVLGSNVHIGYYDQEHQLLHMEKTIFEEIADDYPQLNHTKIRNVLAAFLFTNDDVFKRIADLSGGERGRVSLAKLMLSDANFLILDEPTNHLDITSKEILESALNQYTGTVFFVSHDRYFINQTATRILDLTGGTIVNYIGNYDYYLEKHDELTRIYVEAEPKAQAAQMTEQTVAQDGSGTDKKADWQTQKAEQARIRKLENTLKKAEERIAELEDLIAGIDEECADPANATNSAKLGELTGRQNEYRSELEKCYEEWEQVSMELES